ncbi:methyl-accepting chemotaxis protein [Vibrio sp. SCSIO 43137]|uniref:methyl-accepting chemotaxis protein n=1 Tax=Vibrio sp. SCSIO 43137 TaxID=3021011 RepID=UPI002307157E|nr:methyl-accepting chemotaxis protein [Vibrio sp. SCSIO 43137]WCE31819.1 methyl-accepting chemotaxis protein [Vibrio sp. SCSIO 43137]
MSVKTRIWMVILSTVVSLCTLSAVALYQSNNFMMALLEEKIRSLTEVTVGVADSLNKKVVSGELTLGEAKEQYRNIVHSMRYDDGQEFFFAVDYQGTFIAMGGAPELVGENIIDLKDPGTGRPMTRDLINLARSGGGFYDHNWPKAGQKIPEPKVAYVMGFEPWNMYVGTGLYFDNVNALFSLFAKELGLIALVLTVLLSAVLYYVAKGIFSRIYWITHAMDDVASGDADLTARLDEQTRDEFSQVARSFNVFVSQVQTIVTSVRTITQQVQRSAGAMAESANQTSEVIQSQLSQTELASTAINQMSTTVQDIAQTASNTSASTRDTADKAEQGGEVLSQAISSVHQLSEEIESSHQRIAELRSKSDDIGTILGVIKGIAEQTNLLALNAAIEAARAGEQGRGFAVVADEVRVLAQRTQESTIEIETIIGELQSASVNAHHSMERSNSQMAQTIELSEKSGESLHQIQQNTLQISDLNTQVATATEQQTIVAEEINKNVDAIFSRSRQVAAHAEKIVENSVLLQSLASETEQELEKFRV